jgi:hypothetical protein
MTRHDALVSAILELIDRCGVNIPLTATMISQAIGVQWSRAIGLLCEIERQGDIARHEHAGSTIWIRPRHREQWEERTQSSAPKK